MFDSTKVLNITPADDWWFVSVLSNGNYIVEPLTNWALVERKSNFKSKSYVEGLGCIANDGYVTLVENTKAFRGYVRAINENEALKKAKELY